MLPSIQRGFIIAGGQLYAGWLYHYAQLPGKFDRVAILQDDLPGQTAVSRRDLATFAKVAKSARADRQYPLSDS